MNEQNQKIALIGGDLRQMVTARTLAEDGYEVTVFAMDTYAGDWGTITRASDLTSAVGGADLIVLPLPVTQDDDALMLHCPFSRHRIPLYEVFGAISPTQRTVGGRVSRAVAALAAEYGIAVEDYLEREAVAVANAVPTAEGALAIAMAEVPYTIRGSHCLILGYGRIGKALAKLLSGVGAAVTVAARREEDRAWIRASGYEAISFDALSGGGGDLSGFDIVCNTVPRQIVGASLIPRFRDDVLLLDLASSPGGIDRDFAKKHGYHAVWALSLPGKTAPVTAGHIIGDAVRAILQEKKGEVL